MPFFACQESTRKSHFRSASFWGWLPDSIYWQIFEWIRWNLGATRMAPLAGTCSQQSLLQLLPEWQWTVALAWLWLWKSAWIYCFFLTINPKDYLTDLVANESVRFLHQTVLEWPKKPFLAVVSFPAPHGPEDPAPQFSHLFEGIETHRWGQAIASYRMLL